MSCKLVLVDASPRSRLRLKEAETARLIDYYSVSRTHMAAKGKKWRSPENCRNANAMKQRTTRRANRNKGLVRLGLIDRVKTIKRIKT